MEFSVARCPDLCPFITRTNLANHHETVTLFSNIRPEWVSNASTGSDFGIPPPFFCFHVWFRHARSQSCPFCRDSLKRVNSGDLWIYTSRGEIVDLPSIARENLKRLLMYIEKLPLIIPDSMLISYDPRFRWGLFFKFWDSLYIKLCWLYISFDCLSLLYVQYI